MKKTFVIATSNVGKIQEFAKIFDDRKVEFKTLQDIGFNQTIEETGTTFAENAKIKAQAVAEFLTQKNIKASVLADDSGLEVMALDGRPGIYTARYAGKEASDQDNYWKLLKDLEGVSNRKARFVCALCFWDSGIGFQVFEGECKGSIASAPQGSEGFGYDPVFVPEGFSQTFAQMDAFSKKSMSHRGNAVLKLKKALAGKFKIKNNIY